MSNHRDDGKINTRREVLYHYIKTTNITKTAGVVCTEAILETMLVIAGVEMKWPSLAGIAKGDGRWRRFRCMSSMIMEC